MILKWGTLSDSFGAALDFIKLCKKFWGHFCARNASGRERNSGANQRKSYINVFKENPGMEDIFGFIWRHFGSQNAPQMTCIEECFPIPFGDTFASETRVGAEETVAQINGKLV